MIIPSQKELINVLDAGCQKLWEAKTQKDIEIILMTFLIAGMLICDSFHEVSKVSSQSDCGERNKEK